MDPRCGMGPSAAELARLHEEFLKSEAIIRAEVEAAARATERENVATRERSENQAAVQARTHSQRHVKPKRLSRRMLRR